MPRRIVILDSAKEEFRDIKKHVLKEFGDSVWNDVSAEYRESFKAIRISPEIGSHIDELKELGIANVRCTLVRQTRVVYEFDEHMVLIHMFIHTRRDFRTHLFKRLINQ
ncbi:type II toxin-antitoxin system RelE/ParE family toxin [Zoogloea dura]|uniref:Type II toxin-antitoxin system RelE/ParE family toxin n=1 Tax=Zoogloea dura TaxID=2728840 RepID=A0A848GEJ0_9RHOO|nr:type II toxin-antitoxin system RelE/ParE family toxin [Zoogloea dura]NML27861.1 type II toxin-antitoxin system RelE/ParE family toxin [Zoogloea dura]